MGGATVVGVDMHPACACHHVIACVYVRQVLKAIRYNNTIRKQYTKDCIVASGGADCVVASGATTQSAVCTMCNNTICSLHQVQQYNNLQAICNMYVQESNLPLPYVLFSGRRWPRRGGKLLQQIWVIWAAGHRSRFPREAPIHGKCC